MNNEPFSAKDKAKAQTDKTLKKAAIVLGAIYVLSMVYFAMKFL